MDGWVKIDRKITSHWLWSNPEHLQWWLDMLFMAACEDTETDDDKRAVTLHRGQILASAQSLAGRWHKTKPTVIKFLRKLQNDKLIKRGVVSRRTPVITIVNFDRYMMQDKPKKDTQNDNITTSAANQEDSQADSIKLQLQNDGYWREVMAMRFHISIQQLLLWLDEFFFDQACRGKPSHSNLRDAKQHFNNWLLVKQRIQQEKQNEHDNRQRQQLQRRGFEAPIAKAEEYNTAF